MIKDSITWYQEPFEASYSHSHDNVSLGLEDFRICIEGFGWKGFAVVDDFSSRDSLKKAANSIIGYKELLVYHGPFQTDANENLVSWVDSLEFIAANLGVSKITIIPPYQSFLEFEDRNDIFTTYFLKQGYNSKPYHSIVLDLERSEEELWKSLKSDARRKTRRTEEAGVSVRRVDCIDDLKEWFTLKQRDTAYHLDRMKKIIQKHVSNVEYYCAFHEGKPLAWQGILFGRDVALLECNAISREVYYKKIFANHLLQWEMIKLAKSRDMKRLDWVGAEPDSKDQKMRNIFRFKSNWGGDLVSYNFFTKVINPSRHALYSSLSNLRVHANQVKKLMSK